MYIYKKSLKILALNNTPSISKDKIKWRQRDSNPRSLRCERSAFPAKLCPPIHQLLCRIHGRENGDNRARTCDPMRVMHVLSQLSYASVHYSTTFSRKCNSFFIFLCFFCTACVTVPIILELLPACYFPPAMSVS